MKLVDFLRSLCRMVGEVCGQKDHDREFSEGLWSDNRGRKVSESWNHY